MDVQMDTMTQILHQMSIVTNEQKIAPLEMALAHSTAYRATMEPISTLLERLSNVIHAIPLAQLEMALALTLA